MKPHDTGLQSQVLDTRALFTQLGDGLTLVTANSRLARVLNGQYQQWRIEQGDSQWQSPEILSWDVWFSDLWELAGLRGLPETERAVPGKRQLLNLWEQVLRSDPGAQNLLRPESLASQLLDTRRLAVEWQLEFDHPSWRGNGNENHEAFHRWNRAFETLCRKQQWLPPEDRLPLISEAVRDSRLTVSSTIGLLGFDELNPAQLDLCNALISAGVELDILAIPPAMSQLCMWKGKDSEDELHVMARWVRHCLEEKPGARIAVVVPDLQSRRHEVERHLSSVLQPGSRDGTMKPRPWNVSMGTALSRTPLVESAFDLLALLTQRIDIQDIGRVLRSPWLLGGQTERNKRALLEKCLRENYPRQLKLGEVLYRACEIRKYDRDHKELPEDQQEPQPWNSPGMAKLTRTLMQFDRDQRSERLASAWAEAFDQLLASLGWPLAGASGQSGSCHENDNNWQTFQAWQDALRELASLDATSGKLDRTTAISKLRQICRERIFQPRTPPAHIQVLGIYEVSGLRFDYLWVLGLHSDNWPPTAQPNPFIPGVLQQQAQLPHSSPRRELEVARTVTKRLKETASHTVFSYPGMIDGENTLPSPLLKYPDIELTESTPRWSGETWPKLIAQAGQPIVGPLEMPGGLSHTTARGGTSIIKHQALCPFRAFASNRLGAEGLETPVDGISAMLHGSLVHRVLENFWKETHSQQALLALTAKQLQQRVRAQVEQVLDQERGLIFRPAFREVEGKRLVRQACECLELEKSRDPFEVAGFEQEIMADISGQAVRLIIDRIDRLAGGEQAIIDYKTGKVDPRKWFGERPEDPQLPLYAISAETTPAAVVFFVIRDDGCLYKGVVRHEGIFPDLPPKLSKTSEYLVEAGKSLPQTISNWRIVLHGLMAEFLAGEARIDPKDGTSTCRNTYCELQSLCRIGELERLAKSRGHEHSGDQA